jgi:diguanylate cyclase (GGDEF)-like protein
MSSIRAEREEPNLVPAVRFTQELPMLSAELGQALRDDQASIRGDVLLWQRWVRYLAVGALVLVASLLGLVTARAILPLAGVVVAYAAVVALSSVVVRRTPDRRAAAWFPGLLLVADVLMLCGFVYLTSPPEQSLRILLLGLVPLQLGAFYFGRRSGALAAAVAIAGYVAVALAAPPFLAGPRPGVITVAFNTLLSALIALVLIQTCGGIRQRIDDLRMYCKVVERGEMARLPQVAAERWPDELTLLARGVRSMHAQLAEQIGSDPLTGCMNRRALELKLRSDLRYARRRGSSVGVVAVDLDYFKEINDSHGHPAGDRVLQQVAEIMRATARDTDSVARVGGDEFVIVLPDTAWQGAITFAERLRRHVDDRVFGPAGATLRLTVSIGVALARGSDPTSADMLLQEADTALYKAKTAGRNRVFS